MGRFSSIAVISIVLLVALPATAHGFESRAVCIRVTSAEPIADADLGNAVAGGRAFIQVVDDAECAPSDAGPIGPQAAFGLFVGRLMESLASTQPGRERLMSDDLSQQLLSLDELRLWSVGELAWLNANPPSSCYEALYAYWRKSVQKIKNGTLNAQAAITEQRFGKTRAGIRQAASGAERFDQVPTMLTVALATCSSASPMLFPSSTTPTG